MPKVLFAGKTIEVKEGANLRTVLRNEGLPLYSNTAAAIHCRGKGTCGTCAVQIEGNVSGKSKMERWRLSFPPHRAESELRLACQIQIEGDLKITKLSGLWGHQYPPVATPYE